MSSAKTDSMTLIIIPLFFQVILVIFYVAIYGFTTDAFKFCIMCTQFAGHTIGFPVSFTFITLSVVIVAFVVAILVLLTGFRMIPFIGSAIGGTLILILYQLVPLVVLYAFLAYISNKLLGQIPFNLGLLPEIFLAVFFMIGIITNIKAGLD